MPKKPAIRPRRSDSGRLQEFAAAALLFCATFAAYLPALNGSALWDDDRHLTGAALQSLHGLWRIWFEFGATQQYYPLLHSAFWLEHRLWGDAVVGYHLTNVLLHALSACLLAAIVKQLRLPGAWLAAFLFALHPVCVEAVAWISEQKSTLSTVFYLAAALCYLRFDQSRRRPQYLAALGLFVLALMSKTVTASLPAALLLVFWWQRRRLDWKRDVAPLVPWFVIGASAGAVTAWVERQFVGATGPEFALGTVARCLIAGRAICFYLGKLIWPFPLTFIYPRWRVDPSVWWQYAFPAGVAALLGLLVWVAARRGWRGPLAGFLFFAGTLFPALGFFNVYPFLYSYVADHFQYLASIGVIVPAAVGLAKAAERPRFANARLAIPCLVAVLAAMTWQQSGIYRDAQTLYLSVLEHNPDCWLAHNNLGAELLAEPDRLPEAISHFEAALRLQPNYPQTYNNLGLALSRIPARRAEAAGYFAEAVRIQPHYLQAQNNLGLALSVLPGRMTEAISHYQAALEINPDYAEAHDNLGVAYAGIPGRLQDAITEYESALRIQPDFAEAHYNLANALSDLPGRGPEAIAQYQESLRLSPGNAQAHNNLGVALAVVPGRLNEAIAEYEAAVRSRPDFADAHYNLGVALSNSPGRLQDALAEFETALQINPNMQSARAMKERIQATKASLGH